MKKWMQSSKLSDDICIDIFYLFTYLGFYIIIKQ